MRKRITRSTNPKQQCQSRKQKSCEWLEMFHTKNIYCNTRRITFIESSHTLERRLREAAIQLRKAVWVLQYNVENFDSLNLPETLTHELFSLTVFQQMFYNENPSQVQNMINNYNARIQDLSRSIRSSKMAINNILNNRDLYNYGS